MASALSSSRMVGLPALRTTPFKAARLPSRRPLAVRAEADRSQQQQSELATTAVLVAAGLLAPLVLDAGAAEAVPALLKGRTFSLLHPVVMGGLFSASIYAGYLGFQWRHARELVGSIKELKAQLPAAGEDGTRPASPLDAEISKLEAERKSLIGQKLNEKHANWGSLLLGLGVSISVGGAFNTFIRTGKLFPGPHLWAGAAITILWALAASLTPAMQKGNDTARSLHIALNTVNILLFAWQIPTGLEIVGKVLEFTSFP